MAKTGIFGGAFDPLHNSHIEMAEKALNYGMDKVVFCRQVFPLIKVVTYLSDRE